MAIDPQSLVLMTVMRIIMKYEVNKNALRCTLTCTTESASKTLRNIFIRFIMCQRLLSTKAFLMGQNNNINLIGIIQTQFSVVLFQENSGTIKKGIILRNMTVFSRPFLCTLLHVHTYLNQNFRKPLVTDKQYFSRHAKKIKANNQKIIRNMIHTFLNITKIDSTEERKDEKRHSFACVWCSAQTAWQP